MEKRIGLFKLTSPSGKYFIGMSNDLNRNEKKFWSRKFLTANPILGQEIWDKGWINFKFKVLSECTTEELEFEHSMYVLFKRMYEPNLILNNI